MEISPKLREFILAHSNEINRYQFEEVYPDLKADTSSNDVGTFTEMMLSIEIDPAKYLGYIPDYYLLGSRLKTYNIPNNVTSIGDLAFYGCSGLTSATIGNGVTSIGSSAFSGCSGLTSVTIPDSVRSIREWAFYGCSGLTSIIIPDSVTSIGERAFENCYGLTSATIGRGVVSIGSLAFAHCNGLASITIPDNVTSIGDRAFYDCRRLTSATIGGGVRRIKAGAFHNYSLEEVSYNGTIQQWKNIKIIKKAFPSTLQTIHCTDGDIEI